ncbi:MAG TPA: uroporphyrinogen-III C-methyltransferase, partial [Burkholderiaceae bacterium]
MSLDESATDTLAATAPVAPAASPAGPAQEPPQQGGIGRLAFYATSAVALVALVTSGLLWQRLSGIQEQLARQSADTSTQAIEARGTAREASDLAREVAARQSISEARLGEVALQRSQLEELMQSLSRSRDENLVVDIESSVRLAQQQAQLTGSLEPLLAALKTADQRIARAAQPRLAPLSRAIGRDIDRIKSTSVTDTPGLLARLDELTRLVDDLPVLNAVGPGSQGARPLPVQPNIPGAAGKTEGAWWLVALRDGWRAFSEQARALVRVSRIDQPDAALLAPEQSYFLRENLKLKLLNARLGVLARQYESVRADLSAATG